MSKLETRKTDKIVTHSVDTHIYIYIYIYIYVHTYSSFYFFSSSYVTIQILKLDKTDFVTHLSCECSSCTAGVLRVYLSTSSKRILADSE